VVAGQRAAGNQDQAGPAGLTLRVNGSRPLAAETVAEFGAACDRIEDGDTSGLVVIYVSGVPGPECPGGLSVGMVSKWERALRRLERLPAGTIAVAEGDCGGPALDALLAADYRIMPAWARLVVPMVAGATWPGMALYRLARQAPGAAQTRRALLFGAPILATEARAMGVIDDAADDVTICAGKAMQLMAAAAEGAELAIRRQLVLEAANTAYEEALGVHLAACDRALRRAAAGAA
jgi:isomerase DpgB